MCGYPVIHGCSIAQIQCFVTVVKKNHFFRSTFPLPPNRASFSIAYKTGLFGSSLSVLCMFFLLAQWTRGWFFKVFLLRLTF